MECERERTEAERFNLTELGLQNTRPPPEVKLRGKDRKEAIDWFIYRERILIPYHHPLALQAKVLRPELVIMEDNAPAHIHRYHTASLDAQGLQKLVWPANSPDPNPIETIWTQMKDSVLARLGIRSTGSD